MVEREIEDLRVAGSIPAQATLCDVLETMIRRCRAGYTLEAQMDGRPITNREDGWVRIPPRVLCSRRPEEGQRSSKPRHVGSNPTGNATRGLRSMF